MHLVFFPFGDVTEYIPDTDQIPVTAASFLFNFLRHIDSILRLRETEHCPR